MILMPQIFDVTANENVRYKRNELEYMYICIQKNFGVVNPNKVPKRSKTCLIIEVVSWTLE